MFQGSPNNNMNNYNNNMMSNMNNMNSNMNNNMIGNMNNNMNSNMNNNMNTNMNNNINYNVNNNMSNMNNMNNINNMNYSPHIQQIELTLAQMGPNNQPYELDLGRMKNMFLSLINSSIIVINHPHPLFSCTTPERCQNTKYWTCVKCGCNYIYTVPSFYCTACNYYLCQKCVVAYQIYQIELYDYKTNNNNFNDIIVNQNDPELRMNLHNHPLRSIQIVDYNAERYNILCLKCKNKINSTDSFHYCSLCNFYICSNCFNSNSQKVIQNQPQSGNQIPQNLNQFPGQFQSQNQNPNQQMQFNQNQIQNPNQQMQFNQNQNPNQQMQFNQNQNPNPQMQFNQNQNPNQQMQFNQIQNPNQQMQFNQKQIQNPNQQMQFNQNQNPNQQMQFNQNQMQNNNQQMQFNQNQILNPSQQMQFNQNQIQNQQMQYNQNQNQNPNQQMQFNQNQQNQNQGFNPYPNQGNKKDENED